MPSRNLLARLIDEKGECRVRQHGEHAPHPEPVTTNGERLRTVKAPQLIAGNSELQLEKRGGKKERPPPWTASVVRQPWRPARRVVALMRRWRSATRGRCCRHAPRSAPGHPVPSGCCPAPSARPTRSGSDGD